MVTKNDLQKFIEANPNLVRITPTKCYPELSVIKYKKRVFYNNLWNSELELCRGLVVDEDFNIVARPFTKIYNYGVEARAPVFEDSEYVYAQRKINGFMVAISYYNGDLLISTTGSLDSKYVDYAIELIDWDRYRSVLEQYPQYTFMFECVHQEDPHIIEEVPGMYILGANYKTLDHDCRVFSLNLDYFAHQFGCFYPEEYFIHLGDLKKMAKECKHEGFVFYTYSGLGAKIKSPYYLTKKFLARNPRTEKLMRPDIKKSLDEEYYALIDFIQSNIETYTKLNEQERLQWIRNFLNVQC